MKKKNTDMNVDIMWAKPFKITVKKNQKENVR